MISPAIGRKTVVLAEDDKEMRKRLERYLRGGYKVISASDEKQALEAIRSSAPDLVLLDMMMPSTSGIDVLTTVRQTDSLVPVLVITAKGKINDVEKLGPFADDFVLKPVGLADLGARMKRVLARARPKMVATPLRVVLQELHDSESGRISADKVAEYLGIPLKRLAVALEANYVAVHKTPDADGLQERLAPIKRSLEILHEIVGDLKTVRAWLNSPHPDLGERTPVQVILEGKAGALRSLLENAVSGIPS